MDEIYLNIWKHAKPYYEKGRVYDIPHIEWMMKKATEIADVEKVNKKLLLPIVILHDVGYSKINKSNPNIKDQNSKVEHMREGAKISDEILSELNYDESLKNKIVHYISVHDNWILGDDTPYQECKEMAIFNDLDFLYTLSDHNYFVIMGKSMGKTPQETYEWWLQDEKLTRRPFCCEITKQMFKEYMEQRKKDIENKNMLNDIQIFTEDIKKTFILHIPHSGTEIPIKDGFVKDYTKEIQKLTDWATDKIFNVKGVDKLIFKYSRIFCDVERFSDDDKELMSKFGMGFFYTHTDNNQLLRKNVNNLKKIICKKYYLPHHQKLTEMIEQKINKYSVARIIDCHSFPDTPFLRDLDKSKNRPDICIGIDKFHTPEYLSNYCYKFFAKLGYKVKINSPYSGAIVPEKFYKKNKNVESIMIEINRKLYMQNNKIISQKVNHLHSVIESFFKFEDAI